MTSGSFQKFQFFSFLSLDLTFHTAITLKESVSVVLACSQHENIQRYKTLVPIICIKIPFKGFAKQFKGEKEDMQL